MKMISLKSLKLHNFLSHEDTTIIFNTNQKLLIDGNSGSGKSSILEGIIWAFYGTGRSNNTTLVRTGGDKAEVILSLEQDGKEVLITRVISAKGKHTLTIEIDGIAHPKTGVRDLQEWIETDLTGASYLLFVNSVAYLQGGADNFVTQPAGKRKELLLEIVKTIDFDSYYAKIKTKIGDFEVMEAVAKSSIESGEHNLQIAESNIENKWKTEANLKELETELEEYEKEKEALTKQLEGRNERTSQLSDLETRLVAAKSRRSTVASAIEKIEAEKESLKILSETPVDDIDTLTTERTSLGGKLNATREAITNVAQINSDRAKMLQDKPIDRGFEPIISDLEKEIEEMGGTNTCSEGNNCPNFSATLSRIDSKKEEKVRIESAYEEFKKDLASWEAKFNLMVEIPLGDLTVEEKRQALELEMLTTRIKKSQGILDAKQKLEDLEKSLGTWKEEELVSFATTATIEKDIFELKKVGNSEEEEKAALRLKEVNETISTTKGRIRIDTQELGIIQSYEERIPEYIELVRTAKEKLITLQQNLQKLNLLKEAFGSKGIKSLVIDYILPELEEKINDILSKMSEFRVVLDTQQDKVSGDGAKEGLFITIVNEMGEEMPFENYSGGERLKIVVAITEALATLQKCGFRLFDEVWVGLDEMSLESFVGVLDTLLERFPQVVCVSHLTEIKASFDDKITIIKHNGISHVE